MARRCATRMTAPASVPWICRWYGSSGSETTGASKPVSRRSTRSTGSSWAARAVQAPPQPAADAATERQLFERYCYGCHSERAKAAGVDSARKLTLDALNVSDLSHDGKTWELVARKLRAGMMPPAGMPRPD